MNDRQFHAEDCPPLYTLHLTKPGVKQVDVVVWRTACTSEPYYDAFKVVAFQGNRALYQFRDHNFDPAARLLSDENVQRVKQAVIDFVAHPTTNFSGPYPVGVPGIDLTGCKMRLVKGKP
jgi:hypothetical protein